jgi:hypothetical protein
LPRFSGFGTISCVPSTTAARRIIAKTTRPRPLAIASETLFDPYRATLCGLDTPLHSFSPQLDVEQHFIVELSGTTANIIKSYAKNGA